MLDEGPVLFLNEVYNLISNKVRPNYLCSNNAAVPDNTAFLNSVTDLTTY